MPGSCESIWEKCFHRPCEARSVRGTDSKQILCIGAPGSWQGGSWQLYHVAAVRPARCLWSESVVLEKDGSVRHEGSVNLDLLS